MLEALQIDPGYILLVMAVLIIALIVAVVFLMLKQKKLRDELSLFMNGKDAESLEDAMIEKFSEINDLNRLSRASAKAIKNILSDSKFAFQKFSIVKYDAFKEMGGKLSFSLCMLTDNNDGYILTSMHSASEGCYVYIKEIIQGEAYVLLSDEEKKVLAEAKTRRSSADVEA